MGETVGAKLKTLRNAKKITLKKLSEAVGLSVSYLSQVERGVSSVTINSLAEIAQALGVTPDYFLNFPKIQKGSIVRSHEQRIFTMDGYSRFYYSRLTDDTMKERLLEPEIVSILPLREKEMVEPACHAGEEFIHILEGTLTLYLGRDQITLNPGDSAHYDSTTPHEWVNNTAKLVRILVVCTPALFRQK